MSIVVVGAGPAGLTAAWRLAAAGHSCTVLEAGPRVGGMAASITVAGQRVDLGSHRLHPVMASHLGVALGELLGDELQVRQRRGRIRLGGRWVGFPLRAGDLARSLPRRLAVGAAIDVLARPLRPRRGDSFATEVAARLGPTVGRALYDPFARKLYGLDPADLDAELARRRVSARSPLDIARRVARARRPDGRMFLYPRRGFGTIVERLADAAVAAGATIILDTPARRLAVGRDCVTVGHDDGELGAELVLSTAPLGRLAEAIEPGPPPAVADAIARQRHRAMLVVYLVVERDQYTPFDAHYFPELHVSLTRLSEPKNYRDGPDPAGRTVLCAEIPCDTDDGIWSAPADELGERCRRDLLACGLPDPAPSTVEVVRLGSVYPIYERADAEARRLVADWARSLGPVITLGRQGLFVLDNLHHTLAMGWDAAAAVGSDAGFDRQRWDLALHRYATHVVED